MRTTLLVPSLSVNWKKYVIVSLGCLIINDWIENICFIAKITETNIIMKNSHSDLRIFLYYFVRPSVCPFWYLASWAALTASFFFFLSKNLPSIIWAFYYYLLFNLYVDNGDKDEWDKDFALSFNHIIASVTSPWLLMFVCWLVGRYVDQSVYL